MLKGLENDVALDVGELRARNERKITRRARSFGYCRWQIARTDKLLATHYHGALDGVLELSNIARPVVAAKQLERFVGEAFELLAVLGRIALQEVRREQRDI